MKAGIYAVTSKNVVHYDDSTEGTINFTYLEVRPAENTFCLHSVFKVAKVSSSGFYQPITMIGDFPNKNLFLRDQRGGYYPLLGAEGNYADSKTPLRSKTAYFGCDRFEGVPETGATLTFYHKDGRGKDRIAPIQITIASVAERDGEKAIEQAIQKLIPAPTPAP